MVKQNIRCLKFDPGFIQSEKKAHKEGSTAVRQMQEALCPYSSTCHVTATAMGLVLKARKTLRLSHLWDTTLLRRN